MRKVISDFFGLQKLRKRNYILAVQILILLAVCYIAFMSLVQTGFWNEMDLDVSIWIHDNLSSSILDTLSDIINSNVGASFWITIGMLLCIPKKSRKAGIVLLAVIFLTNDILLGILKGIAARTRPWMYINLPDLGMPGGYSFPSGHTIAAFAAATVFYLTDKRIGRFVYIFAAFVAFSRVYMFAHFASDVIVGAVIGSGTAFVICLLITEGWDKLFDLSDEAPHPNPAPPEPDDTDYGFHRLLKFRDEGYGTDRIYDWVQARKERKEKGPPKE